MFYIIHLIAQAFAHSAMMKKGAGIGAGAGLVLGLAYASSKEHTDKMIAENKKQQAEVWKQHKREGDIILNSLNNTLSKLDASVERIDDRTFYLYKREIEKNQNNRENK